MSQMEKAEREAAAGHEAMLRAEAAKRLEEVLDKSRTPATA
jgi:hypothetical protein